MDILNEFNTIEEARIFFCIKNNLVEDVWAHTDESRAKIATKLGVAEITVKTNLRSLCDKGLIYRIERGKYRITNRLR